MNNTNVSRTTPKQYPKTSGIFKTLSVNIINFSPPHTVLRFVGPSDNIYSCGFVQILAQRLENAFDEAQDKVLETYNRLTVEVLSRLVVAFYSCKTVTIVHEP